MGDNLITYESLIILGPFHMEFEQFVQYQYSSKLGTFENTKSRIYKENIGFRVCSLKIESRVYKIE